MGMWIGRDWLMAMRVLGRKFDAFYGSMMKMMLGGKMFLWTLKLEFFDFWVDLVPSFHLQCLEMNIRKMMMKVSNLTLT